MYKVCVYDLEEGFEWLVSTAASIEEARKLKDHLRITFKMLDVDDRARVYIYNDGNVSVS